MFRKILSVSLLFCLSISLLLGQVTTDTRADNASVIEAPNGVTVIRIAKPDSNGLSKNTYEDFNIPNQGIVFNNSSAVGTSQLAGVILGNPNYDNSDVANLILNQVVSNNSSNLEGYAEVYGANAGVIIANPNGITCSGCGFINASRIDLITGTSRFNASGQLTGFGIANNGKVIVSGSGLDGSEVDYLNLVSRYHNIQAQITANKKIRILSGNNEHNYQNNSLDSTTLLTPSTIEFAVDISALSNLQAGSIIVIGTEAGLGVNNQGHLVSSLEGIEIDSAGKMRLENLTSNQGISLKSKAEITTTAESNLQAKADINIEAAAISLNSVLSLENFTASTDGTFSHSATLRAKDFHIKALEATLGDITADGSFNIQTQSGTALTGNLVALADASITADNYEQTGSLYTNEDLSLIISENITIDALAVINSANFQLQTNSLVHQGIIQASTADFTLNQFSNTSSSKIQTGKLTIDLTESGSITNFHNQGELNSNNLLSIQTNGDIINDASVISIGDLILTSKATINNQGTISANQLRTNSASNTINNITGIIQTTATADIYSQGNFDNKGEIHSQTLKLTSFNLFRNDVTGKIQTIATTDIRVEGNQGNFDNKGLLSSNNAIQIYATGEIKNQKDISANQLYASSQIQIYNTALGNIQITDNTHLDAQGDFYNYGIINTNNKLKIQTTGSINNQKDLLSSGRIILISTLISQNSAINNTGKISANQLQIESLRNINNKQTGEIYATSTADIQTKGENSSLYNKGKISIGGDLSISTTNKVVNETSASIQTGGDLNIQTKNLNNRDLISSIGDSHIQTTGNLFNQKGVIYSFKNLYFTAGLSTDGVTYLKSNDFTNEGGLIQTASEDLEIHSNKILNAVTTGISLWTYKYNYQETKSVTYANRGSTRTWSGTFTVSKQEKHPDLEENRGRIYSGGNMKLIANGEIKNDYSYIRANKDLTIEGKVLTHSQMIQLEKHDFESYWVSNIGRDCNYVFSVATNCWDVGATIYRQKSPENLETVVSIIDVGGDITGTLEDEVSDGDIDDIQDAPNSRAEDNVTTAQTSNVDSLSVQTAGYSHQALVLADSPLFTLELPSETRKYAIETRLEFIDLSTFYGSEYFFAQSGWSPGENQNVLGDAFYDQQKIQEEITQLAVTAYLSDESLSPQEIMKLLLDNAIEVIDELELSPGVALTKAQIDRLTKDIVWYVEEEITIAGVSQGYLVPRLYTSKATTLVIDAADGSIISARNVDIKVKGGMQAVMDEDEQAEINQHLEQIHQQREEVDFEAIISEEGAEEVTLSTNETRLFKNLTPAQAQEVQNLIDGLKIEKIQEKFKEERTNKIQTLEKEIASKKKELKSKKRTLKWLGNALATKSKIEEIEREIAQSQKELTNAKKAEFNPENYEKLAIKSYLTVLDQRGQLVNTGTIRGRESVTLYSENHINNHGAIQSGAGGISLAAEGNVNIESQYIEDDQGSNVYGNIYNNASLNTTGNLQIVAGQDINITAADIKAEGDANLIAITGNLTVQSIGVRNQRTTHSGNTTTTTNNTIHQISNLDIGGNLTTYSKGNTILQGAEIKAGGDANLTADGGLYSIAVHNTYETTTVHKDRGNWFKGGKTNTKEWNTGEVVSNGIETGGNLSLSGKNAILLQATNLKAGKEGQNDINLTSEEGSIAFETATEWDSYSSENKGRGLAWQTDKGHGYSNTNEVESNLQGNINLSAKKGVKLAYVKQGDVSSATNETDAQVKARLQAEGGWQSQVLEQSDNITFEGKANTQQSWEYNASGMTPEAQFAVAVAIAASTGGVGAAALGATGGLGAAVLAGAIGAGAAYGGTNIINSVGKAGGAGIGEILQNTVDTTVNTTEETLSDENFYREIASGALGGAASYGLSTQWPGEYTYNPKSSVFNKPLIQSAWEGVGVYLVKNVSQNNGFIPSYQSNLSEKNEEAKENSSFTSPSNTVEEYLQNIGVLP